MPSVPRPHSQIQVAVQPRRSGENNATPAKPSANEHKRRIDPSERQATSSDGKPNNARHDHAHLTRRPHDRQPFQIKADRRHCHQNGPEPTAGIGDRNGDRCKHQRGNNAHQEIT